MHSTTQLLENRLVERNRGTQQGVDNVGVIIKLLMDHQSKNTHLGSSSII